MQVNEQKYKICQMTDTLPADATVLNRALMLLNLTMSEKLIKQWLKKVRIQMEFQSDHRRELEMTIRKVTNEKREEMKKAGRQVDSESSDGENTGEEEVGKIYLHEFLALVANAFDRQLELEKV